MVDEGVGNVDVVVEGEIMGVVKGVEGEFGWGWGWMRDEVGVVGGVRIGEKIMVERVGEGGMRLGW
ncbi:hypothetical protein, partial [Klebsiella pneumoniae]|uniref:hypothetical protein n=1 Tax=Klebsiella pneumoniae TaxID=573 RepID=UPI001C8B784A